MRRAIFTLVALGVLLPLAAETARARGNDRGRDRGRNAQRSDRDRSHESKGLDIRADEGGISIGYHYTKDRGRRGHRSHRNVRVGVRLGAHRRPVRERWVAGHYVIEERQVRLPDRVERVWIPDRYEVRRDCRGHHYRVLVEEGHYEKRIIPGRIVVERVKVWVAGHYERY